ncbi:DUF4336 domain-containing protein [Roseomonas elaeocarpi]|uniref:DUF4336 domain-containing protein n=1 Tax=Roseomonas elaeocarpi TaxID=907779 RepID=A0ABV6JVV6_9PROT
MPTAVHAPLDTPKPLGENLWIVDSGPLMALGVVPVPIRMTVARLGNGDLWLHSPTRLTEPLFAALAEIGPIRHIVAPNIVHWTLLRDWQRRCPEAITWAAPGLRERGQVRRSGVRLDTDLGSRPPEAWAGEIDQVVVPGGLGFHEVAFFHRPSRTTILTDLIQNFDPNGLPPPVAKLARVAGIAAPEGGTAPHLRAVLLLRREAAAAAVSRILDWRPEQVIFAHGQPYREDAAAKLRRAMRWLV